MTWLTPMVGIVAASIAVPALVILYFLKLRRRDLEVSTTLLWKKAIQDLQANAPFQKLRRNILLLLQLLALGAALFAVAQPQMKGGTFAGNRHIILVDRSASMSSLDGDLKKTDPVTRLEEAKRQAKDLVDSLREPGVIRTGSSDEAMIIAFDSTAEVRHQFSSDKASLKAAIDAIVQTDAPTMLGEAMRLAKAHQPRRQLRDETTQQVYELEGLEGGIPATIHLYSDGKVADAESAKPGADDDFVFHGLGSEESGNIGIVALRAERAYDDPNKLSIFVVAQSTFKDARTADAELSIDGSVVRISSIKLPAAKVEVSGEAPPPPDGKGGESAVNSISRVVPSSNGVVFEIEKPEAALVQIRLRNMDRGADASVDGGVDVLSTDDRAWLIVPPAKRLSVAVVTAGNLFITSALKGLPLARLEQFTPEEYEKLLAEGRAGTFDVFVLDGYIPRAAKTSMPPGRYVVVNAIPPGAGIIDKGKGPATLIVDWARQHPLMRAVNLDGLVIAEARVVEIAKPVEAPGGNTPPPQPAPAKKGEAAVPSEPVGTALSIASTDQGPAVIEASGPAWRAIVVPFDPGQSNWPFDVSYVVFMASAVDYVGGGQTASSGAERLVQPGTVISDRLPIGTTQASIRSPDGQAEPLIVAADGRIVFGPVRKVGVYEITYKNDPAPGDFGTAEKAIRPIAADLLDSAESDVASAQELALASRVVKATAASSEKFGRRLWPYLLLGVLGLVMLEWFVYNRKVHV